ncbi:uncharacterized protein C8A04DRAFT_28709 [Dichotomopilus funicola]|uniref:Uncharacterized protein n=1 Tax=Dichotomopilus funicola TaxID=1934379 RepID=A0AAN6V2A9_9PEZI|nr:hypothetical protein C8A04DRAFT_28709 [Dichotomopilus funicola]
MGTTYHYGAGSIHLEWFPPELLPGGLNNHHPTASGHPAVPNPVYHDPMMNTGYPTHQGPANPGYPTYHDPGMSYGYPQEPPHTTNTHYAQSQPAGPSAAATGAPYIPTVPAPDKYATPKVKKESGRRERSRQREEHPKKRDPSRDRRRSRSREKKKPESSKEKKKPESAKEKKPKPESSWGERHPDPYKHSYSGYPHAAGWSRYHEPGRDQYDQYQDWDQFESRRPWTRGPIPRSDPERYEYVGTEGPDGEIID